MQDDKNFIEWIALKERLHEIGAIRSMHEGEIWWCAMGENVGVEINGKNEDFSRPILIFKKLSTFGFLGVPLTSKEHRGSWYVQFRFNGKDEFAALAQVRVMSVFRLYNRIGQVSNEDYRIVKDGFRKLYIG